MMTTSSSELELGYRMRGADGLVYCEVSRDGTVVAGYTRGHDDGFDWWVGAVDSGHVETEGQARAEIAKALGLSNG